MVTLFDFMSEPAVRRFITENGGTIVRVTEKNAYLLPSGASMKLLPDQGQPILYPPPPSPRRKLELRIEFHKHVAALAEKAFDALKTALLGGGQFRWSQELIDVLGPEPQELPGIEFPGTAALLALRDHVATYRKKVADFQCEYEQLPEVVAQRKEAEESRQRQAKYEARLRAWLGQIEAIQL